MEKITKVLESLGLNDKEVNIYIASLFVGQNPEFISSYLSLYR